jgi:hypothetical protein
MRVWRDKSELDRTRREKVIIQLNSTRVVTTELNRGGLSGPDTARGSDSAGIFLVVCFLLANCAEPAGVFRSRRNRARVCGFRQSDAICCGAFISHENGTSAVPVDVPGWLLDEIGQNEMIVVGAAVLRVGASTALSATWRSTGSAMVQRSCQLQMMSKQLNLFC